MSGHTKTGQVISGYISFSR